MFGMPGIAKEDELKHTSRPRRHIRGERREEMFDNLFNEKAIKELAAVLAKQDAQRTANETLREMDIKSIGLAEKIKEGIDKILI